MRRAVLRSAIGTAVLHAFAKVAMLLASVLLARLLGAHGYGLYAAALAAAMLLGVAASLGLPTVVVRLLPLLRVRDRPDLMRGLLLRSNQATLAAGLLFGAVGAAIAWRVAPAGQFAAWCWAMALVPLIAVGNLRSASLRGLQRVVIAQLPECAVTPALFLAAAALAWWISPRVQPEIAVVMRGVATLGGFAVGSWVLLRVMSVSVPKTAPSFEVRLWSRSAMPSLLVAAMGVLMTQIDVLILAALRGSESAGVYQATARGAELVAFSVLAVNFAVQPLIASLYAAGDFAQLQRMLTLGARLGLVLALPVALGFGVLAEPLLVSVFGSEFGRGAACLAILCTAQTIGAALGSVEHIMNMTGNELDTALALGIGAAANVLLNLVLVPVWDIEGAAVSFALSAVLWRALLALKVHRRLGLWPAAIGGGAVRHLASANA
jgi:O-antigen/teichoic acid export membrane protein